MFLNFKHLNKIELIKIELRNSEEKSEISVLFILSKKTWIMLLVLPHIFNQLWFYQELYIWNIYIHVVPGFTTSIFAKFRFLQKRNPHIEDKIEHM